jgi:hypothetical protein
MEMMLEGPMHVLLVNRLYVTLPVMELKGVPVAGPKNPLVMIAASLAVFPTTIVFDERVVERLGLALLTVNCSHVLADWS